MTRSYAARPWLVIVGCLGLMLSTVSIGVADDQDVVSTTTVDDPLRPFQWNLDRIRAPEAWEITRGSPEVTIAIVDTGVDTSHRDLADAFWTDPVTGVNGFDHIHQTSTIYLGATSDWHGTAIAGVAAARADDGYGMAGVAPEVSLMVHRIYGSTSSSEPPTQTSYSVAAEAVRHSAAAGADVILLTWGGVVPNDELFAAIRDVGVPVVAAAGNDGQDLSSDPSTPRYPAMYRLPNLITVAATDRDNQILEDGFVASNFGKRHVDIAAPGDGVISIVPGGEHTLYDGTSFAAPHVAGALALGRAIAPGVPDNELVGMLVTAARRSASLRDKVTSGGVLDVAAFLRVVERPVCVATIPPADFPDLDRSSLHVGNIDCIAWYGVTQGTGDGFVASRTITRGETATLLVRALEAAGYELPADPTATFDDIEATTHEASIRILAEVGLVSGVGGGTFEPHRPVTRGQMASMVIGVVEEVTDLQLPTDRDWFDDIERSAHADAIVKAREAGITLGGAEPRSFMPSRDMTRGQMASFLARMLDVVGRQGVTVEQLS